MWKWCHLFVNTFRISSGKLMQTTTKCMLYSCNQSVNTLEIWKSGPLRTDLFGYGRLQIIVIVCGWRCGSVMVSALDSGLSPGQDHCVVFLGKTLYSHRASLRPGHGYWRIVGAT